MGDDQMLLLLLMSLLMSLSLYMYSEAVCRHPRYVIMSLINIFKYAFDLSVF